MCRRRMTIHKKLNKKFLTPLVLLVLLFYGLFAQYAAYQAGLLPSYNAERLVAVAGFDAEKPTGAVIVAIDGAARLRGFYAIPQDMELRELLACLGVQRNGDVSAWDLAHQPEQGDQYFIADLAQADSAATPWLVNKAGEVALPDSGRLNINTATLEELQQLPNIGPGRAQAIIDYRLEHHGFRYPEELLGVKGIGDKIYNQLKDRIEV